MDLFTPIIPEAAWHPNFAALMRRPSPWDYTVLNDWASGFVDRDQKFVREFQTTFNSSFWELYLHAVIRERGLTIDFGFSSPDFVISCPEAFAIEAAIASHAQGALPEHYRAGAKIPNDLNELNRLATIRLSNALQAKYDKYKRQYSLLPHVAKRPFVIALAPFDRPHFNLACQRAIEAVLYGYHVDEEAWMVKGVEGTAPPKSHCSTVSKHAGADIGLGVFQNGSMTEVSAVIFSSCATWGKVRALSADANPNVTFQAVRLNLNGAMPHRISVSKAEYKEALLDGLRVYHNPDATHPLDPVVFRCPEVMQAYFSEEAGEWIYEQTEGQLMFRLVTTEGRTA